MRRKFDYQIARYATGTTVEELPGLDEAELMDAVERFYGEYYFRPHVVWRVVRKALFNSNERRGPNKEAREYLSLRSKRKRFVLDQRKAAADPAP